jgi:hypothetical protein
MTPFLAIWDGENFEPVRQHRKLVEAEHTTGRLYRLAEAYDRSMASHRGYFAEITDRWASLPEQYDGEWPSPDHLRKWALIKTGFCHITTTPCKSRAEAERIAAHIRRRDTYAVVWIRDNVVHDAVAKSQSMTGMNRAEFQESKTKVLQYLSELMGIPEQKLAETGT